MADEVLGGDFYSFGCDRPDISLSTAPSLKQHSRSKHSDANITQLHTFKNGEVADAEKINENFAAIDQEGPSIELLPLTFNDASDYVQQVTVSLNDPSGIFQFGPIENGMELGEVHTVVDGSTLVTSDINAYLGLNTTQTVAVWAEDMKGNKAIGQREYQGRSTLIQGGIYRTTDDSIWDTIRCPTYGQEEFNPAQLCVQIQAHPSGIWPNNLHVWAILHEEPSDCEMVGNNLVLTSGSYEGETTAIPSPNTSYFESIAVNGASVDFEFASDSSSVQLTYEDPDGIDCIEYGNSGSVGPYQKTFTLCGPECQE